MTIGAVLVSRPRIFPMMKSPTGVVNRHSYHLHVIPILKMLHTGIVNQFHHTHSEGILRSLGFEIKRRTLPLAPPGPEVGVGP